MLLQFVNIGNYQFELFEGTASRGMISSQAVFNFTNFQPFQIVVPDTGQTVNYYPSTVDFLNPLEVSVGTVQYYLDFQGVASVKVEEEQTPIALELCTP